MRINRFTTFVATFVMCTAAMAALEVPNPSMADLSGSFRLTQEGRVGEDSGRRAALDKANDTMTKEYGKLSKAIKKAAGAVGKMDAAFDGDADYANDADFFVTLVGITVGVQQGNSANFALIDEIQRDPLRFSRIIQKNNKVAGTFNESDPGSKISKAKNRKKKLAIIARASKYYEKLIKRYGKNNESF